MLTKKYALLLKSDVEITHCSTNLSQKHKIICLNKIKLGANSKKYFLIQNQISQYVNKNWNYLKKSYNCFWMCLIFRFLRVLPIMQYARLVFVLRSWGEPYIYDLFETNPDVVCFKFVFLLVSTFTEVPMGLVVQKNTWDKVPNFFRTPLSHILNRPQD